MRLALYILFWFCVCDAVPAMAQKSRKIQEKADRYFNEALAERAARRNEAACARMEQCLKYDTANIDANSLLGQWYFQDHRFDMAVETFRKASVRCFEGREAFIKPLVKSLIYAARPDEALQLIAGTATVRDSADWNQLRRKAEATREMMKRSWAVFPQNLGLRINTAVPELFPSMAVDTQFLFFTRRVNNIDEDLYAARADSCGGWFKALNIGEPTNTAHMESSQFISADGHYLFFTRCDNRSENGWDMGGCDMYMAYRIAYDSAWTQPQPFGRTINTPDFEGMPSLSPDNMELYFVSDRKGGYGGYDIWYSRFDDGLWRLPVNAGPGVNTPGNEIAPFIAPDNKTLFFSSDYWPGMGGADLFVSRRQKNGKWGKAENMGYPINTACEEKSCYVALNGRQLYYASDRGGPTGNYDIYVTDIPAILGPTPMTYLQGFVVDSITREPLNSAVMHICNARTGDTLYELRSNRGDASYVITLEPERTYAVHTARMGYQPVSDTLLMDTTFIKQPMHHNVAMLPYGYDPVIHFDTLIGSVHFDVNVTELNPEDKRTLQALMEPWLEEKGIVVYVNAYTDNTGTPMINEGLSYKRAAIIAREIALLGIPETSIEARGWGEANAIATNDTEEGRYKNRRVEIVLKR